MHRTRFHPLALLGALLLSSACRLEKMPPPADPASAEATIDSVANDAGIETGEELTSYRRDAHFDFTGDGRPEEVKIRARGTRSDALEITLRIEDPRDSVLYSDRWSSAAYLEHVDGRTRADRRAVRALVQSELERILADTNLGEPVAARLRQAKREERLASLRYDVAERSWQERHGRAGDAAIPVAERDSVEALVRTLRDGARIQRILADVEATRRYFYYSRGGEDRLAVAWSPSERRFVTFWRCC